MTQCMAVDIATSDGLITAIVVLTSQNEDDVYMFSGHLEWL